MAEYYFQIKHVHLWAVTLSLSLFAVRAALMLAESRMQHWRTLRVLPHVIDTVLLTSALMLTTIVHQYPFVNGWLTAKVCGLVAYVVLGSIALKRGRSLRVRRYALAGAIASAAFIVSTALHHDPNPLHWFAS
jgi:uncharacterized membrane protein SirB2